MQGISLLDLVGKVLGRIAQDKADKLKPIAEDVLPDSQCTCGFRTDKGCIDTVIVARQLVENAREHQKELFAFYVNIIMIWFLDLLCCISRCSSNNDFDH